MMSSPPLPFPPAAALWRRITWFQLFLGAVVLGLLAAPWTCFGFDVVGGFLLWATTSHGTHPWAIYSRPEANYPPFVFYLLTAEEKVRLLTHTGFAGKLSLVVFKLPNVLAWAAGIPLCWFGLRRALGESGARTATLAYALCLPLFFNAAIWGQYDALLSLAMALTLVALINDRPGWAGAAFGWALAIKFQAVLVLPAGLVYLWRRSGGRGLVTAGAAAVAIWGVLALPFLLHGATRGVLAAYTNASGYYPYLTISAFNGWYIVCWFDMAVRHLPQAAIWGDSRHLLPGVTFKQFGTATLGLYTLYLMAVVWRKPTPVTLVWASALNTFALFILPTEMHERYIVPAAALMALAAGASPRSLILAIGLSLAGLLNQWVGFHQLGFVTKTKLLLSVFNVGLFWWATVAFWREVTEQPSAWNLRPRPAEEVEKTVPQPAA